VTGRVEHLRQLTLDVRNQLANSLDTLRPDEWSHPTLCDGWNVRDVLAHLVAWDAMLLHRARFGYPYALVRWSAAMSRSALRPDRFNRRVVAASTPPGDLLNRFCMQLPPEPHWLFDRMAPGAQLAEYVIHHEDIRRPLDGPALVAEDALRGALEGVVRLPEVGARARLTEHRWVADDIEWAHGRGRTEVRASAADLLLALAGRHVPTVDPQLT
jgi:uncharacterized protein (TIGR03083 family)